MTINLPEDLERSVRSLVSDGRFASEDEAVVEALRSFLGRERRPGLGPGSIGAMRDAVDDLDAAAEHAMKVREARPGRLGTGA